MNKKYSIITISREYATYGLTIASALSDRLGIPYYAKDFVKKAAKQSGYSVEDVENAGENMTRGGQFVNNFLGGSKKSYDEIFEAQRNVVIELAKKPCIIVGRCSDYILKEAGIESFNVFLYSDIEGRILRARQLLTEEDRKNKSEEDIVRQIAKMDSKRSTYYKQYTGRKLGDYKNYDICLNVGRLGVKKCIEILGDILE